MAFTVASSSSQHKFHVFISFRGEDTRNNFTSHLYHAFYGKKIKAYIDEESLKKGDEISPALMRAIQESLISVVILSENYASSSWCLDELNHILQCKEINNQIVVPVFYGVSPSQVEKQKGSYGSTFAAHEDRFKDQMDKVQQWRNSLTKVANLKGWNSLDIGSSSKLVEAILKDILEKLHHMLPYDIDFKDLVGMEKRIQRVESLLNIDSLDIHIVGIWGMGGIGKTTLARVIFNRFASQFESFYFLENVKEESEQGLTNLQKELFSKILLEENSNLHMVGQVVTERLRQTKVFIVLDDVDDVEQFEYLVRGRDRFGDGSKIIVTTRDKQVLINIGADKIYEVEELDFSESQDLFCSKAFPRSTPTTDYTKLFKRVVWYSGGIPLALKVLGSHLQSKSTKEWESELDKLETIPNNKVHNVLKTSYDGLDSNEKEIFLDIACFFNGQNEYFVKRLLNAYGNRFMDSGIRVLVDKTLITTRLNSVLKMHNLLQEMGRKIVCDESRKPGKRSRLWLAQDIYHVLKYKTGTGVVQGMSMSKLREHKDVIHLDPLVFKEMHNLKFISFRNRWDDRNHHFEFPQGLKCLPDELRYIRWDRYPLKYLSSDFTPRNLVELHLRHSKLEHLWNNGVPNLENLKVLNLSYSRNLIQIQDLSLAVNLEEINLGECSSLESLPDLSLCVNLKKINLLSCSSLKSLSDLSLPANLNEIYLSFCYSLKSPPDVPVNIKILKLSETAVEEVPHSIEFLSHLKVLDLSKCKRLKKFPITICKLKSLETLDLCDCSELEYLPDIWEPMARLRDLHLNGSGIRGLPSSIQNLIQISELDLNDCKNLRSVPQSIYHMPIEELNLSGCSNLENFSFLTILPPSLRYLNLSHTCLSEIPDCIFSLPKLRSLRVARTMISTIPESIKSSKELNYLNMRFCKSVRLLPELPCGILEIDASGCTSLEMFSNTSIDALMEVPRVNRSSLYFLDCLKLDYNYIITEFQTTALCLAAANDDSEYRHHSKVHVCYTGDEIPKWFNHQNNDGSRVNVKLSPHNLNFMGSFATAVVIACKDAHEEGLVIFQATLACDICIRTNEGEQRYLTCSGEFYDYETNHISNLMHMHMWDLKGYNIDFSSAKEISFDFKVAILFKSDNPWVECKVIKCGIRLLHLQDAAEYGIISRKVVDEESNNVTHEQLQTSGFRIIDCNINDELPPKRIKFFNFLSPTCNFSSR